MARLRLLPVAAIISLCAASAWAEENVVQTQSMGGEVLELLEDVVDGVGGVLKVLVGPPVSSPSRHLNLPGAGYPEEPPPSPMQLSKPSEPKLAPPPPAPVEVLPVAPPEPLAPPVAIAPPPAPLPAPTPVVVTMSPRPAPPPPQAKPPVQVTAQPQPASSAQAEAPCTIRLAATATMDQAARLPRCK